MRMRVAAGGGLSEGGRRKSRDGQGDGAWTDNNVKRKARGGMVYGPVAHSAFDVPLRTRCQW